MLVHLKKKFKKKSHSKKWLCKYLSSTVRTVAGADFRADFVANCLRGAFPPVDLRAVCFVRAIVSRSKVSRNLTLLSK